MDAMQSMAARDLAAAAEAVKDGNVATALALALDAVNSLTGTAVEQGTGILLQPVEIGWSHVAEVYAADVKALDRAAHVASEAVGHVRWAVVKAYRDRVEKVAKPYPMPTATIYEANRVER